MDVSISEQILARILRKVETGNYASTDEVLGSALTLLDERDEALEKELAEIHEGVKRGAKQANEGQIVGAQEVFDALRQRNESAVRRSE